MELRFFKMHGCGNDYIFVDNLSGKYNKSDFVDIAKNLSDRHFGIGGDGLVVINKSSIADAKMNMYNSDGSEGRMCGNAVRCIAKYLTDSDIVDNLTIRIETLSGIKSCTATMQNGECNSINVDMGLPVFDTNGILKREYSKLYRQYIDKRLTINGVGLFVSMVSMGNPHTVIFCDRQNMHKAQNEDANLSNSILFDSDLSNIDIAKIGYQIEQHKIFLDRTNVEFVKVVSPAHLQVRVWERGSGETLACGTGACAIVAVACKLGICNLDKDIIVELRGGKLTIKQTENTIYLKGSCEYVFDGTIYI